MEEILKWRTIFLGAWYKFEKKSVKCDHGIFTNLKLKHSNAFQKCQIYYYSLSGLLNDTKYKLIFGRIYILLRLGKTADYDPTCGFL